MTLISQVLCIFLDYGQGTVGRAIVEDKVLEMRIVLPDNAQDGLFDQRLPVVGGGDDGDEGQLAYVRLESYGSPFSLERNECLKSVFRLIQKLPLFAQFLLRSK